MTMEPPASRHCEDRPEQRVRRRCPTCGTTSGCGEAHVKQVQDDVFLHGKQRDAEQSQNHQLDRADLPEEGAVGDQGAGHTEVCVDEAEGGQEQVRER